MMSIAKRIRTIISETNTTPYSDIKYNNFLET